MTLAERFEAKVDKSGGPEACWPWTAALDGKGYGAIQRGGRGEGRATASRVALELVLGREAVEGKAVLHHCDNPPCCNPAHLFLGTQADNMADMRAKGRAPVIPHSFGDEHWTRAKPELVARGERAGRAKLTESQVLTIRSRSAAGEAIRALAREYGMAKNAIACIVKRKTWAHI